MATQFIERVLALVRRWFFIGVVASVALMGLGLLSDAVKGSWPLYTALGLGLLIYLVRKAQEQRDATRRKVVREQFEEREGDRHRQKILNDIGRYFPFLERQIESAVGEGKRPEEAFLEALEGTESVTLGTTFYGLPAILPLAERQKHLYVVGKTGSGKSSLLIHLLRDDLLAGRGIGVIAPEGELFRDWVLPLIPEERAEDVIYFAPGKEQNRVTFNPLTLEPGDDQGRAAEELFAIFKRAVGEDDSFGPRMTPILANSFAALVGRPGATLFDVKRMLEDEDFRVAIASDLSDPYARAFWLTTYPSYPKGSHLPIVNRLDQFLRPLAVRRALCHPSSSFSIRRALAEEKILLFDLSGLAPESMLLLGQMLLSKFQLELMRREQIATHERTAFMLYADEFQTFSSAAEGTWRELLSRGRRYGLGLTLAHQYPSQLPSGLQDEIFGNVASIVAFALCANDAQAMRKEFLEPGTDERERTEPAPLEAFVTLRPGEAVARLGSGAYALPLKTKPPLELFSRAREWGERVRAHSSQVYGVDPIEVTMARPQQDEETVRTGEKLAGEEEEVGEGEVRETVGEKAAANGVKPTVAGRKKFSPRTKAE